MFNSSFLKHLFDAAKASLPEETLPIEALIGTTLPCFNEPDNSYRDASDVPVETLVESIETCEWHHLLVVNGETNAVYCPTIIANARLYGEPDPTQDQVAAFEEIANAMGTQFQEESNQKPPTSSGYKYVAPVRRSKHSNRDKLKPKKRKK